MTSTLLDTAPNDIRTHYVSLSDEITQLLLNAFIDGELVPGARINDLELATRLGVSRTPVREALRGLQALGIVETLPARVTRVARLSAQEFVHAQTVWSSLYRVLLADVMKDIKPTHIAVMTELCERLSDATAAEAATISFRFFDSIASLSENTFLQESVNAAACRMRLGFYDASTDSNENFRITFAQASECVAALKNRDLASAQRIVDTVVDARCPAREERFVAEQAQTIAS